MKQYNGVPLDGRAMQIQIATSELNGAERSSPLRRVGGGGGRIEKPKRGGGAAGARYELRNEHHVYINCLAFFPIAVL